MSTFSTSAKNYHQHAIPQKQAAEKLLKLARILPHEHVLDLGCGPGHIAIDIARSLHHTLYAIDEDQAMVATALEHYGNNPSVHFSQGDVETFGFSKKFEVIFCNSVFHWCKNQSLGLDNIRRHLNDKGRLALQMPIGHPWCELLHHLEHYFRESPETKNYLEHFQSPWTFYENETEIIKHFQQHQLHIRIFNVELSHEKLPLNQAYNFIHSAWLQVYKNPHYYSHPLPDNYGLILQNLTRKYLAQVVEQGQVTLSNNRIFLIAYPV